MNAKRAVLFFFVLLLALCLQAFFAGMGGVFGVSCDAVLAVSCVTGAILSWWGIPLCALFAALSCAAAGIWLRFFLCAACCALSAYLSARRDGAVLPVLFSVVAGTLTGFLWEECSAFLAGFSVDFYAALLRILIPKLLLTSLFAIAAAFLLERLCRLDFFVQRGGLQYHP